MKTAVIILSLTIALDFAFGAPTHGNKPSLGGESTKEHTAEPMDFVQDASPAPQFPPSVFQFGSTHPTSTQSRGTERAARRVRTTQVEGPVPPEAQVVVWRVLQSVYEEDLDIEDPELRIKTRERFRIMYPAVSRRQFNELFDAALEEHHRFVEWREQELGPIFKSSIEGMRNCFNI